MDTDMTFAEYMKSDDGKRAVSRVRFSQKKKDRIVYFLLGLMIASVLVQVVLSCFPDDLWHNRTLTVIFLSGMGFSVVSLILTLVLTKRIGKATDREGDALKRAVMLFWRENPIDWSIFSENNELLIAVEGAFEEHGLLRRASLLSVTLSRKERSVSLDLSLFCGAIDDLEAFLGYTLLPYLRARESRGETYRTIRFFEQRRGKILTEKKDGFLVKDGKLTKEGKRLFETVQKVYAPDALT